MSKIGDREFNIELNDSVFETKGWRGSRYDGQQLNQQTLNQYTEGDTTLGKTPNISNYTTNLYVGSVITDYQNQNGDKTLLQLPSSSYVVFDEYLSVDTDTLKMERWKFNKDFRNGRNFWYDDFKEGTNFSIVDLSGQNNTTLRESYRVISNVGMIHKMFLYQPSTIPQTNGVNSNGTTDEVGWYRLSSPTSTNILTTQYQNKYLNSIYPQTNFDPIINVGELDDFMNLLNTNVKNNQRGEGDDEWFVWSFLSGSLLNDGVVETTKTYYTDGSGNPLPLTLQSWNTTLLTTTNRDDLLNRTLKVNPTKQWIEEFEGYDGVSGETLVYMISKTDNTNPSLLTDLVMNEELPNGVSKFVVIPHNLHPTLRDNLNFLIEQTKNIEPITYNKRLK